MDRYQVGVPLVTLQRYLAGVALAIPALAAAEDCFDAAAAYHQVNPYILRAIALRENPKCDSTVSRNSNKSTDWGCMQVNSVHFPALAAYGIAPADLLDPCKNIYVGAWQYKNKILKFGNTWAAVGAYHSESPERRDRYALEVYRIWLRIRPL